MLSSDCETWEKNKQKNPLFCILASQNRIKATIQYLVTNLGLYYYTKFCKDPIKTVGVVAIWKQKVDAIQMDGQTDADSSSIDHLHWPCQQDQDMGI